MKKYIKVFLLVVFTLACVSSIFAQTGMIDEQLTVEQLREEIRLQKQQIREAAKMFLVDELPSIIELDPDRADLELQKFSSVLRYLGDDEVLYLLGHMYSRVGENDKAISIFDSLLKTDLNQGARKMLNLVLYRKLIGLLQAGDRQAARDYLRIIVFENYNTEQYFPAYLYLYSDLSADSGNYQQVITLIESYNANRDIVLNHLLPLKQQVLSRVNNLNIGSYYDNPTQAGYNQLSSQIDQIKVDLTAIYNQMIGLDGMIFVDAIVDAHKDEMAKLDELKVMFAEYANTSTQTQEQIKPAMVMIESVKQNLALYDRLLKGFDNLLQQNFLRLSEADPDAAEVFAGDLYLDRIIQTQRTIQSYDEIIKEIDALLASGDYPQHTERLVRERQWAMERKAESEVLYQKYMADLNNAETTDKTALLEILGEYNALVEDQKMLTETAHEMESYVVTEARTIINEDLRAQIRPRISAQIGSVAYSADRDQVFTSGFSTALTAIDFITLQMEYRALMAEFNEYLARQSTLSAQEMEAEQTRFRNEQLELISQYTAFIDANPYFSAIEQPGGGSLAEAADLYYNLAELQYYAIPTDLTLALNSYKRALQLDPLLPDRDLALYNVAFISSELQRRAVDDAKIAYRETARGLDNPPANALYSQQNFSEAHESLTEIVENYPESKIWEESVYRLGLLYFSYSTDSDDPDPLRAQALDYFDQIVAKPKSPLYYDALYQRGWVRLNSMDQDDLRLAMTDFMELLMATDAGLISDPQVAADYREDAVDNIAYCLIALDGTDFNARSRGVAELQRVFEGYSNQQIVEQVLDRSASLKLDMGVSLQAIDFLEFKIATVPMALNNPVLLDSILVLYHSSSQEMREGENLEDITQNIYQRLIDDYNHESQWYTINKSNDITKQMEIVNNAYIQRGYRLYNTFVQDIKRENIARYEEHIAKYGSFAQLHNPDYQSFIAQSDSLVVNAYMELASRNRGIQDFSEAIRRLYAYNDKYPTNSLFYENEKLALDYALGIYEQTETNMATEGYNAAAGEPANLDEAFVILQNSADRFIGVADQERFRTPARTAEVIDTILLLGDFQFNREKYPEAARFYNQALSRSADITDTDKRETYLKLAEMSVRESKHTEAENWFRQALPLALNNADRETINREVLLQIQNSYEAAAARGDFMTEASERLRLAEEFATSDNSRRLGQRNAAVDAFINAKAYQQAIDLLMELATTDTEVDAIYTRYAQAINIAESDSLMNDPALAKNLEAEFISKHPASKYAFGLRLAAINALAQQTVTRAQAAEQYLALYEEVQAGSISNVSGDTTVPPEDLLADSIRLYNLDTNVAVGYPLMDRFIASYPNHENVVPYMEIMAAGHFSRNEMEDYKRLAREIFRKDPSKNQYYQNVAERELLVIANEFDAAYQNKDFTGAFAARDRYRTLETAYKREGLNFDQGVYDVFARVQKEYDDIQKRNAYLANYDSRLSALERSKLFTDSPAAQIRVNNLTTWDRNLGAGDRRIPKYFDTVNAEANKVLALIKQAAESGYDIDNDRQIRAYALLSKVFDRGAEVVGTQIRAFFSNSEQGRYYTSQWGADAATQVGGFVSQNTMDYVSNSINWSNYIFTNYYLAGYQTPATEAAKTALTSAGYVLEFRTQEFVLDDSWQQTLTPERSNLSISQIQSPKGQKLGSTTIPANTTLMVTRSFNVDLEPDFAFLQFVFPDEIELKLNGNLVPANIVPVDSLDANKPATARYSILIPGELFTVGENTFELSMINPSSVNTQAAASLLLMTNLQKIRANIPPVVKNIYTNQGWRVVSTDAETGEESAAYATEAPEWNINWDNLADMEPNPARPIWVSELDAPADELVFETEFILDTEFREGMIEFIAPENVTVYLNGSEIGNAIFDYDPEPLTIYKGQVPIPIQNVVEGRNVIRFKVNNSSIYRGFLAHITYSQAGKEDIR
ncbi:MAG: hypothetical protein RBQ67_04605 [Candidatus Cloacimonadaceae bacterium]|jgi:hypothetical protein|nr:hypothetical protein [Candidatus Cloacimonadaceae bacterium]